MTPGRRGRPRLGPEAKTSPLPCRTTHCLRMRIEAAALKNKWSLSREIEDRLRLTFDLEEDDQARRITERALGRKGARNGDS